MTQSDRHIDAAIEWHVRLSGDDADWDGFSLWLEADPAHRHAYDQIALADRQLDAHLPALRAARAANDDAPGQGIFASGRWASAALAAALVVLLGGGTLLWQARQPKGAVYETGPAATRMIALADGARIHLDRNSKILLTQDEIAEVRLDKGAAFFDAPADPDPSFDVRVGDYRIQDIGTQFGVSRFGGQVQVQVATGEVQVAPDNGEALSLRQGRGLQIAENSGHTRAYHIAPTQVSSWRTGQLIYDDIPIAVVVADIQRSSGLTLAADPRIADQHFTGVLIIGDGTRLVSDFSTLTGFVAERRGKTVYFRPAR